MRWWTWVWVATLLIATGAGAFNDWEQARPVWYGVLSAAAGMWCAIAAVAHFVVRLRAWLGRIILPASVVTLAWMLFSANNELREPLPGLPDWDNTIVTWQTVGALLALFGPAIFYGFRDGYKAWADWSRSCPR